MYCSYCGTKNIEGANYCYNCGENLNGRLQGNIREKDNDTTVALLAVFGWVSAVISLLFFPPIFGGVGIIIGFVLSIYRTNHGLILAVMSCLAGILGFFLGMFFNGFI